MTIGGAWMTKKTGAREPIREEKHDRNAPCACGSGKKYKKCCAGEQGLWARLKSLIGLTKKPGGDANDT